MYVKIYIGDIMTSPTHQIVIQEIEKGKPIRGRKAGFMTLNAEGKSATDMMQTVRNSLIQAGVMKIRPKEEEYYIE
jgi:hypothetical protein